MPNTQHDEPMSAVIRRMLRDWEAATPAQRDHACACAKQLADAKERALIAGGRA